MTFIYNAPSGVFPYSLYPFVTSYMNPGFYQGWSLFAPDVGDVQNELWYRTSAEGQWSDWVKTTSLGEMSHHPKLEEISEKLNHNLSYQLKNNMYFKDGRAQFDKVIVHKEYHLAAHYCKMHHMRLEGTEADSIQMRIDFNYALAPGDTSIREDETFLYPKHSLNQK